MAWLEKEKSASAAEAPKREVRSFSQRHRLRAAKSLFIIRLRGGEKKKTRLRGRFFKRSRTGKRRRELTSPPSKKESRFQHRESVTA